MGNTDGTMADAYCHRSLLLMHMILNRSWQELHLSIGLGWDMRRPLQLIPTETLTWHECTFLLAWRCPIFSPVLYETRWNRPGTFLLAVNSKLFNKMPYWKLGLHDPITQLHLVSSLLRGSNRLCPAFICMRSLSRLRCGVAVNVKLSEVRVRWLFIQEICGGEAGKTIYLAFSSTPLPSSRITFQLISTTTPLGLHASATVLF